MVFVISKGVLIDENFLYQEDLALFLEELWTLDWLY